MLTNAQEITYWRFIFSAFIFCPLDVIYSYSFSEFSLCFVGILSGGYNPVHHIHKNVPFASIFAIDIIDCLWYYNYRS